MVAATTANPTITRTDKRSGVWSPLDPLVPFSVGLSKDDPLVPFSVGLSKDSKMA